MFASSRVSSQFRLVHVEHCLARWLTVTVLGAVALACGDASSSEDGSTDDVSMAPTSPSSSGSTSTPPAGSSGGGVPTEQQPIGNSAAEPTNSGAASPTVSPSEASVPEQPVAPADTTPSVEGPVTVPGPEPEPTDMPSGEPVVPVGTPSETPAPSGEPGLGACSFQVNAEVSSAIETVGIVTWSTDMTGLTGASIEFGLEGSGPTMAAPAELTGGEHRTLLLGMKGSSTYTFHIVAQAGGELCTSEEYTIETGPVANSVPNLDVEVSNEAAIAPGFMVLTSGIGMGGGGGGGGGGGSMVYIVDQDGDPVWWIEAPTGPSRARMDWEGKNMWMTSVNVGNNGGSAMRRVSMDGLDVETNVEGLADVHHDFCVLPGGIVTGISWVGGGNDPPSELLERSPDGTITSVATIDSNIYNSNSYHANAIHYHPTDDAYTISDRNPNLYVKVSRQGDLIWQLGGNNPVGASFSGDTSWSVNHGHHFTSDGHFLIFNNNGRGGGGGGGGFGGGASLVLEYILDEDTMTAELIWEYDSGVGSGTLGDVQRLPNGNTLVTYSNSGTIHEVGPDGNLVRAITAAGSFGYVMHRPTLYGPPPKSR